MRYEVKYQHVLALRCADWPAVSTSHYCSYLANHIKYNEHASGLTQQTKEAGYW